MLRLVECSVPILQQLEVEEALLRAGEGNWCILNHGSPPAIVLGLSSSLEKLVDLERVRAHPIPVIRRFSGGGTVVVDEDTLFFTLILEKKTFPVELMEWTRELLAPAFLPHTLLVEGQDYVIQDKKIGGNAQSFSKGRSLHHTSFLWTWDKERMKYLNHPENQPSYRRGRAHDAFCGCLADYFSSKSSFIARVIHELARYFPLEKVSFPQAQAFLSSSYLKRLQIVEV